MTKSASPIARVCILYPADPLGAIPGGIDTFIRGMLRWAPDDIELMLLGATTDTTARPVGKWTRCELGKSTFMFFPVLHLNDPRRQKVLPTSFSFTIAIARVKKRLNADLLVFHGVEPIIPFFRDGRPKSAVIHQDMEVLRNPEADIKWRHLPSLYFYLERLLLPRLGSVFCVRQSAVETYKRKFAAIADRFYFTPTWVDKEVFRPPTTELRLNGRARLQAEYGIEDRDYALITVGRLDSQKNPKLLIESFCHVVETNKNVKLLMVGEGQLRHELQIYIKELGIVDNVIMCGVKTPEIVCQYLHGADIFVLSSAYEGMPMCVLEALACGLPVVSTEVGEINRVVFPQSNGELVSEHNSSALGAAILKCIEKLPEYRGAPCVAAVEEFSAENVLTPIFQNYRDLISSSNIAKTLPDNRRAP